MKTSLENTKGIRNGKEKKLFKGAYQRTLGSFLLGHQERRNSQYDGLFMIDFGLPLFKKSSSMNLSMDMLFFAKNQPLRKL